MDGSKSRLLGRYFMSTILYLPTSAKGRTQAPIQESEARETGMCCSQTERIAHDLKNCMSVLLLAILAWKLLGSVVWGWAAGILLATESLNLVQSRVSMLDINRITRRGPGRYRSRY